MRIYKYWATASRSIKCASSHCCNYWCKGKPDGKTYVFKARVGSNLSQEDAERRLALVFDEIAAWEAAPTSSQGKVDAHRKRLRELYGCGNPGEYASPICEEILSEIDSRNIVTRNWYGAEVLNSEDSCFVDIDYVRPTFREKWSRIFGKLKTCEEILSNRADKVLALPENDDLGIRLYKTAEGFRMVVHGENLKPGSPRMMELFRVFNADDLYTFLCVKQQCYRARLSPKPSRIGVRGVRKAGRFPFGDDSAKALHAEWVDQYNAKSVGFAVCKFLFARGRDARTVAVDFHDQAAKAFSTLPLK